MPRIIQTFLKPLLALVIFSISSLTFAQESGGQYIDDGKYQIHYIALGTTLLTPQIAKNYGVERSRFNGFINISILDTSKPGNPPVNAKLTGKATNLLGQDKELVFKEFIEGEAIYYIAEVPYRNEEQFNIQVNLSNEEGLNSKLNFKKKFWVD